MVQCIPIPSYGHMSGHHAHHYKSMGVCEATMHITITIPTASPRPVLAAAWLPAARPGMLHRGIHTGHTSIPDISDMNMIQYTICCIIILS